MTSAHPASQGPQRCSVTVIGSGAERRASVGGLSLIPAGSPAVPGLACQGGAGFKFTPSLAGLHVEVLRGCVRTLGGVRNQAELLGRRR